MSKQAWFVSRQSYWGIDAPECNVVEIAYGGIDYANADMLCEKYEGEGEEYTDPVEALDAAIRIRDAWTADRPDDAPHIEHGFTGGNTIPFTDEPTDEELRQWAEETKAKLPRCERCGGIISGDPWKINDDPWDEQFCSESCADDAWSEQNAADEDDDADD